MREADLEKHLTKRVEALGGITAKMTIEGRRGWPDRLIVMPGGVIAMAELKKPGRSVTSATQHAMLKRLAALGVLVAKLFSIEDVDIFVNGLRLFTSNGQHMPAGQQDERLWAVSDSEEWD